MKRLLLVVLVLSASAIAQKSGFTVSITAPANGASFTAPASITISASASDTNGTITQVAFFANGTAIGKAKTAPYNFLWSNVTAGTYSLAATATDSLGASVTSSAVSITVTSAAADFTISASPTAVSAVQGGSGSTTVTVASVNGFNSATSLSVSGLPSGVTGSFSSSTVTPPSGSSASSTLTLSATSTAAPGTYTVTVTGTSGSITHSTSLSLTVTAATQTNYVGYVDHMGCDTIAGWAADRNRLNTSINVEIYDGSALIQTVFANISRPDVGSALGDNGLHGYNITTPSRFLDGLQHQVHVKFETSATELTNSPASLTCPTATGPIQGYKIDVNSQVFNSPGATITIDGSQSFGPTVNPYGQTVTVGSHTVTSSTPAGFTVSYSLCNSCTDHSVAGGHPFVAGTSVTVNVTSGGYVDLWWKYTAAPVDFSTVRVDPGNRTGLPGEDLLSGNYNWSLPVVSLKGRAGLDLGLALTYNSLVWTKAASSIEFDADRGFPGPGFRLGFPTIEPKFFDSIVGVNAYLLIMPSGARIEVRQVGTTNTYESGDSTYIQVVDNGSSGLMARTPNGNQLSYQLVAGEYRCTQVEDRNGNFITVNYNGFGHISSVVDTLGRTITFNYDSSQLNLLQSITQTWNGAQHTWASFIYGSVTLQTNFTGLTLVGVQNGQSITAPTQVTLADGSYFTFQYTSWGQVSRITRFAADNHELAHVSYDLPVDTSVAQSDCPRFTQRRDFAENWNGGAEAITSFVFDPVNLTGGQMTTPDGTQYKESFGTSTWQRGLTTQTQIISGGVAQKSTAFSYTQDNTTVTYKLNPRPVQTTITDAVGTAKRSTVSYSTFTLPSGVSCSLAGDVLEYAADTVTTMRRTHTDYVVTTPYLHSRVLGLPSMVSVFDGNGVLASQIAYQYDQSVQDAGTVVQHDNNFGSTFLAGRGNLTSLQRFDVQNSGRSLTSSIGYDTVGNLISTMDPAGHQMTVSYSDSFSAGTPPGQTAAYQTSITNADNFVSIMQYNYDTGALTLSQDPKGAQQLYTYDSIGRLLQETYHDSINNVDGTHTRYAYSPSLNKVQSFTLINPGVETSFTQLLDGAGRIRQTMRDFPGSTGGFSTQQFVYDVMGRLAQQSNHAETDGNGTPAGDDVSGFVFSTQQFDWAGRPTVHFNPDGTSTAISYSGCGCAGGLVETSTDEVGRNTRTTHDVLGRPIKVELLNLDGTVYKTTATAFDALDHISSIVEQQGSNGTAQTQSMTYDGFGRLASEHSPEQKATKSTGYSYYADDTLQSVTDGRGAVKTFSYNGRKEITQVSYTKPDGSQAPGLTVTVGYDAAGNRINMTDSVGSVSYTYDTWSRLLDETRSFTAITNRSFSLDYTYNLAGQLTSLSDPFKGVVSYSYDASGQLAGVTGAGKGTVPTYLSSAQYRAFGPPKQLNFGDSSVETFTYDPNTRISGFSITDPLGTQLMGGSIGYFGDGRLKSVQDVNRTFDHSFTYDQAGRISSAHSGINAGLGSTLVGPYDESFGYDVWSNMLSRTETLWAGDAFDGSYSTTYTNNRNAAWTYDTEGNPVATETTQFGYNAADQQVTSTDSSRKIGTTTLSLTLGQDFDGDGLLADQSFNGSPTYYVRSSVLGDVRIADVASDGTRSASYIYSSGGWLLARFLSGTTNWVHINPATQSEGRTQPGVAGFRASELDPLGNDAGLEDPGINPAGDGTATDLLYPKGGDPTDLSGGCTLDGAAVPCSINASINGDAIDIARPTTLGIWSKSLGQYVGITRYDPSSGQYIGVIDGHVVSGNPGGPVAIDGRYQRNPPTLIGYNDNPSSNASAGNPSGRQQEGDSGGDDDRDSTDSTPRPPCADFTLDTVASFFNTDFATPQQVKAYFKTKGVIQYGWNGKLVAREFREWGYNPGLAVGILQAETSFKPTPYGQVDPFGSSGSDFAHSLTRALITIEKIEQSTFPNAKGQPLNALENRQNDLRGWNGKGKNAKPNPGMMYDTTRPPEWVNNVQSGFRSFAKFLGLCD